MTTRRVAWTKESVVGAEHAVVTIASDRLTASSVAIADDPLPYRVDYELETGPDFVTARLFLRALGDGWERTLDLGRDADGTWTAETTSNGSPPLPAPGGNVSLVEGALDCDVAHSPVTNSMPVLRYGMLDRPGSRDFLMAWVSLPDLAFRPSRQRYVSLADVRETRVVRYESLDGTFTADLTFDADGLVIDYPELGRRLG
jgi:uncharacterized protein